MLGGAIKTQKKSSKLKICAHLLLLINLLLMYNGKRVLYLGVKKGIKERCKWCIVENISACLNLDSLSHGPIQKMLHPPLCYQDRPQIATNWLCLVMPNP